MESLVYFVLLGAIVFVRSQVVGYWKRLAYFVLIAMILTYFMLLMVDNYNFNVKLLMNLTFTIIGDTAITVGKDMVKWAKGFRTKYKDKGAKEVVQSEIEEWVRINKEMDVVYDSYLTRAGAKIRKLSGFDLFLRSYLGIKLLNWIKQFNNKFNKDTASHKFLYNILLIMCVLLILLSSLSRVSNIYQRFAG